MSGRLPCSVTVLDAFVVAEHPHGHRVLGQVVGAGTTGVALRAPGFTATVFLSYDEGWSVRRTEDAPPTLAERLPAVLRGGHCCFAGCTLGNCNRCDELHCVRDFHVCEPITTADRSTTDGSRASNSPSAPKGST